MLNWFKNAFGSPAPLKAATPAVTIEYLLNDPLTPDLKTTIEVPTFTDPPRFVVQGWKGYAVSDIQKQAGQVYACLVSAIRMVQANYHRPLHWATTDTLVAIPRAGRGCNAFYDRSALNFFYDQHPVTKNIVFTANSVNVVSHEFGHAVLDAMRPDFWNIQSLEVFAFHEAFGDIISLLTTMQSDLVLNAALRETANNLRKSNVISRIGEEMGNFMYATGRRNVEETAVRNAVNSFIYVPPETLPQKVNDLSLSQEPHSYSRLFTGIWYDCLVSLYEYEAAKSTPIEAFRKARDIMAFVTLNAVPMVAVNPRFYTSFAKSMLAVAQASFPGDYFNTIRKVMLQRKVVAGTLMASRRKVMDLHQIDLTKLHSLGNNMCGVRTGDVRTARLLDLSDRKLKTTNLPVALLSAKLEMPTENQYTLDSANIIIDEVSVDENYLKEAVRTAVSYLHHDHHVGDDGLSHDKCFCIKDGKLVRQRSCLDSR
jgi:hypothetical protein